MKMNELLKFALAGIAGVALGTLFFGGLWWTVRRAVSSPCPAFWLLGSLLARMAVALTGFYLVAIGGWQQLIVCLAGFIAARVLVTRLTRPQQELIHAS